MTKKIERQVREFLCVRICLPFGMNIEMHKSDDNLKHTNTDKKFNTHIARAKKTASTKPLHSTATVVLRIMNIYSNV